MRMLDHICRHVGLDWTLGNFIFLIRTKTLILTVRRSLHCATLGEFWSMLLTNLEEYGRANFGVQQLPLFNLLKPEDVDWLACLSWSEGGRWLNTRVPRNLHSHEVVFVLWCREWAYRCHLEIWWIGGWAYRCHLDVDRVRDSLARTCIPVKQKNEYLTRYRSWF